MASRGIAQRPRVILVTDAGYGDDHVLKTVEAAARALPPGAFAVQLRDKKRPIVELRVFASRLRMLTRQTGALLVINGDAQLARDVGADGVHLGGGAISIREARRRCGPSAFVSIAAHSDAAVRAAKKEGADAALVSPIFQTDKPLASARARAREKANGHHAASETRVRLKPERVKKPRGVEAIASARIIAGDALLVFALGGVTSKVAARCRRAGADGVAVIRALLAADDPAAEARALFDATSP